MCIRDRASRVDEFISEEQIFDYLFNKGKEAVFLQFYTPGHSLDQKFMRTFEESSKDERYDKIQFVSVHCRKNLTFCLGKAFTGRQHPFAELYYINEQD